MGFFQSGGKPGPQPQFLNVQREVFYSGREHAQFIAKPVTIDGTLSSNPTNSPYTFYLFAGTLMGKVTATGKYANSILGLTSAAVGGAQTTLNTDLFTAAEIVRRIGASGTFTLTGDPALGLTVRSKTATYSAVNLTTGAITISALATGAVNAVNQINNLVVVDATSAGTFTITVEGVTTPAITYSSTAATLFANINTQLNATFGTSAIVASGGSLAAIILTFSGTGFAARPVGTVTTTVLTQTGTGNFTINGVGTIGAPTVSPVGTAGVTAVAADEGEFVAGSLIQPTDGSQTILTIICDQDGVKCADATNVNRVDAFDPQLLFAGGTINTGLVVNYPSDPGIQAYIKTAVKNYCIGVGFYDSI